MHSSLTLPAGRDAGLRCARADRLFVDGGKWTMLVLLLLAVLLPLTAMLWRGFAGEPGQVMLRNAFQGLAPMLAAASNSRASASASAESRIIKAWGKV